VTRASSGAHSVGPGVLCVRPGHPCGNFQGVEVIEVNPAWTSVIGAVNYASRFGLSVYLAAAIAIARCGLSFSENAAGPVVAIPVNGDHVTFLVPERNPKEACVVALGRRSSCRDGGAFSAFPVAEADPCPPEDHEAQRR
jgi:hypothetical protein